MTAILTPVVAGNQVQAADLNQYLAAIVAQKYVMSGATPPVPGSASLTLTYGVQQATVVNNAGTTGTFVYAAAGTQALSASQDYYVDLGFSGAYNGSAANGTYTWGHVANGASAPSQADNTIRLWKVVTSGTTITGVTLLAGTLPVAGSAVQTGTASGVAGLDSSKNLLLPGHLTRSMAQLSNSAVAPGVGLGTGATTAVFASGVLSTDQAGYVDCYCQNGTTAATDSSGLYPLFTVTFGVAYSITPVIVLSRVYASAVSAVSIRAMLPFVANPGTSGFTLATYDNPTTGQTLRYAYAVVG